MIPPFNELGYLPPGIYPATLDEIDAHFGQDSEQRRAEVDSLGWMIELAREAGIQRIILNGSFVTDIMEPGDVDCVLLGGPRRGKQRAALKKLRKGLPYLAIVIARPRVFDEYISDVYATDRSDVPKGMIEVIQWT
ncbi:MAG TPA: hypothetical protein VFW73_09580 [Lacipirellulaceae bacterium]|nr:hypothetical protein [Lacipirellulaceae bacterium]